MKKTLHKAVAIVGVGAVMPDAPNLPSFWNNIQSGKYSISDVPADRWDINKYYNADPKAPDKTYSRIGGWVKDFDWDPMKWRLPIPPKVSAQMDLTQQWAISTAREALLDFDYLNKDFDRDRTAVILGVAMGGDQHLYSAARILFPEYAELLTNSASFSQLPSKAQKTIIGEMYGNVDSLFPGITEDTMPGELSNVVAGRIASLFNFHGPNFIADAACASAVAGMSAAIEGLEEYDYDVVITGGIDANMAPSTFVKFCKIGALSATGTRPYADGADGFIMGEGGAVFILKRLEDAERDGDKIYAVIRALGGSSDGKGKGITAPNPVGQKFAIKRAWQNSGVSPATATLIEGHGTSTSVGDAVELQCLQDGFGGFGLPQRSIALGSVKSNIGHLKGAAGAAGIIKATMALHHKMLPPSLNFNKPNPGFNFSNSPFEVNTQLRPWEVKNGNPRRCGVSAFGFGGTNFHVVMEEYIPGKITSEQKTKVFFQETSSAPTTSGDLKNPLRGAFVKGGKSRDALLNELEKIYPKVRNGWMPPQGPPSKKDLNAPFRIAIDYGNAEQLVDKLNRAIKGIKANIPAMWFALNANGIFYGDKSPQKTAFLFTGQGSQYINMLKNLKDSEPIVAQTFAEADEVMQSLVGRSLSEYIFHNTNDEATLKEAHNQLMQTEITQPAVLTCDVALYRLMTAYGINPDYVIGHSLGEYGALVASKAMSFAEAIKAVSARGSEMAKVKVKDNGIMAAIFAPPEQINEAISKIDGYVEIANFNSLGQSVIGGESKPVLAAMKACGDAGLHVAQLPVSHAFHTKIVAPASEPLARVLFNFDLKSPSIPIIANITGDFYPMGKNVKEKMIDILSQQVASPVQFVKGINKLYDEGVRTFVEMGPKKALHGFVRDIMSSKDDVSNLFTNHPKIGDIESFNQALCGLYADGLGLGVEEEDVLSVSDKIPTKLNTALEQELNSPHHSVASSTPIIPSSVTVTGDGSRYDKLGRLFVDFMDKANAVYGGSSPVRQVDDIWITGASLGLPGVDKVFQDSNIGKLLRGDQLINNIPAEFQQEMLDKNITRLVKTGKGGPRFETISQVEEVIKLAARKLNLDIVRDFGFPAARKPAIDSATELAIGAGIDALRDAGIPLVMHYKTTTTGSKLPDRWLLPDEMKDSTGIIFASAFPGFNSYAKEITDFHKNKAVKDKLALLQSIRKNVTLDNGTENLAKELDTRIKEIKDELKANPYSFNRRFLLRVLSMGHSQFAEYIGARGPNTQINSACASTTMAIGLAKDWIEAKRCKRVIIIAADDITSDDTIGWFSSGFLAAGAAATDDKVENAALPFDKRRHGMIVGMGGVAIVVEGNSSAQERGIAPICEVLGTTIANSAFHGTRLDVQHIKMVMEDMIVKAEKRWNIDRHQIADQTVFISHETYTPARGGSAAAEINALRHVFGSDADKIVIANTKGMTGHAMAVGIEDVLAIKSLETGIIPPVPNFRDIDPELGNLNLSKGGSQPVGYALRLGAGFGSQISMSLLRWTPVADGVRRNPDQLGYNYRIADEAKWKLWLERISGKENPEMEVSKRTLRIKDPLADKLIDVQSKSDPTDQVASTQIKSETPRLQKEEAISTATVKNTPSSQEEFVKEKVLNLIAEKTGYPADMLDPELDLEADLGIDTVKQAELFADIRAEYGIERDDTLQLSEFPTMNHIFQFVFDKRPDLLKTDSAKIAEKVMENEAESHISSQVISKGNEVQTTILELVAEKTGYPEDMLDPELDLEADLGIDTVKQAELFADIRGVYGIERDETLQLSEFPTMNHIFQFVLDRRPDLVETNAGPTLVEVVTKQESTPSSVIQNQYGGVKSTIIKLISEKTGYPEDMLDPELDLEADLGIDTVKQAELFAEIRGEYGIERDENLQLSEFPTMNHIFQFVVDRRPDLLESVTSSPTSDTIAIPPQPYEVAEPFVSNQANKVKETIINLISEKTGYPEDMLDPELDLEADLGIDTVKQAELFAEIRGEYGIEIDENLQLSEFPTMNHIIQFVMDKRPDLIESTSLEDVKVQEKKSEISRSTTSSTSSDLDAIKATIINLISEKTGYPEDMLDPELDLEADLGIDTVKQAELFADIRGVYGIERDENLQLAEFPTMNHIFQFVINKRPDLVVSSTNTDAVEQVSSNGSDQSPSSIESMDDEVKTTVLKLISEKTGYPEDMLDPELDLEADLGIDTVKQAELFADIRGVYGIERDEALELADFPTMNHIIQFVYDRRPDKETKAELTPQTAVEEAPKLNLFAGDIEAVVKIPRRIPIPQLRPELKYCKSSGVTLNSDTTVIVMKDNGGVGKSLVSQLEKTGVKVFVIDGSLKAEKLSKKLAEWTKDNSINGVYWLPAMDYEGELSELTFNEWKAATHLRIKLLYTTMRELQLLDQKDVFLISGTRMGGQFGYDPKGSLAPLGGAVSGFTKAYKREHPDAQVKVVDFEKSRKTKAFAQLLIEETLKDNGIVEVGYSGDKRWTIGMEERAQLSGEDGMQLNNESVFLVTGAAGSITSAITADLASASGGTFHLLDLTPEPDSSNKDIQRFGNDKEGLKRDIFSRLKEAGEKATPVRVDKELAAIERGYSALAAIQAIENAGGKAYYYSVNLLDNKAVSKAIKKIISKSKKIDVLLHAGGIEISRLLPDKSPEEFDLVFDIKSDGWYNLMSSIGDHPIGATVVFSSIAGRFGNGGQTDYSAANDFLCKSTSGFRTSRPETRGIALDWTAWGGIGMAARGSIPTVMKAAGIDMLPPEAGIPFIRKELIAGTHGTEIVVAQSLGMMMHEFDETGGLDTTHVKDLVKDANGIMVQEVTGMGLYSGLTTKANFDPKKQGFLFDHEINGTPVLPGVMGIEAMVEATKLLFPDHYLKKVEEVDFLAPFKFYRSEPRDVMVKVLFTVEDKDIIGKCELYGARKLHGQDKEEIKVHFKAIVRLTDKPIVHPKPLKKKIAASGNQAKAVSEDIYKLYFHGPAYQVIEQSWKKGDDIIGMYAKDLPFNHKPKEMNTYTHPRLVELCFQSAGIWEMGAKEKMGLPEHIDTLRIFKTPTNKRTRLYTIISHKDGSYNASVVDSKGEVYLELKGYTTAEFVSAFDEELLEPLKRVTG